MRTLSLSLSAASLRSSAKLSPRFSFLIRPMGGGPQPHMALGGTLDFTSQTRIKRGLELDGSHSRDNASVGGVLVLAMIFQAASF